MAKNAFELLLRAMVEHFDERSEMSLNSYDFFMTHFTELRHFVEEILDTLHECGRIDVFKYMRKDEIINISVVKFNKREYEIVSSLYEGFLRVFEKTHFKKRVEVEDVFSIREYVGSFEKNTLTVVINV